MLAEVLPPPLEREKKVPTGETFEDRIRRELAKLEIFPLNTESVEKYKKRKLLWGKIIHFLIAHSFWIPIPFLVATANHFNSNVLSFLCGVVVILFGMLQIFAPIAFWTKGIGPQWETESCKHYICFRRIRNVDMWLRMKAVGNHLDKCKIKHSWHIHRYELDPFLELVCYDKEEEACFYLEYWDESFN